jgi:hypothetical protein
MTARVKLKKYIYSGRGSQGAWRQDGLIGDKTASRKVTLALTLTELNQLRVAGGS